MVCATTSVVAAPEEVRNKFGVVVAQKVAVQLVDDVDGSEAESTVEFGLDGVTYTIDLSAENADHLREVLEPFVAHGRRIGGRKRRGRKPAKPAATAATGRDRNQAIREWAREQGFEVSERGRIPAHIAEQYDQAH